LSVIRRKKYKHL